ncbi:MAG: CarD family transcriptional regulator [bacterium]|nr:CarD family transcriptional regulator [bacterium]
MFIVGSQVIHPIHGLGIVQSLEEQEIMGQKGVFACIYFAEAKLSINVRAEGEGSMIRPLISSSEMQKVLEYLKVPSDSVPAKSSDRYNVNIKKLKSNDIYKLAEVVRDLTILSLERKLSPKEQNMLKQTRKAMAIEFACLTNQTADYYENEIDEICRDNYKGE